MDKSLLYNILAYCFGFGSAIFLMFFISLFKTGSRSVEDLRERAEALSKEKLEELNKRNQQKTGL